ncbi:GNAT family N-acetyltransferase [Mycetocola zhujimingii]|uniref:GNAT family N-acetyltransferase n=1 Tax=Mycetocola zhujimingii TaxID=2079792 RepID=A0A2U1TBI4_9MICO|nr:GNAT family N-acetyltransferase [Mycetocola zhujimingii]PWC06257.1 GNAT family N-acetyltransferase [Mycetocola zhujimingii]
MRDATFSIRPTTDADWREVRRLRLEMLADTPIAFGETLAHAQAVGEAEWRMRGRRGTNDGGTVLVAITNDGRWVGTMGTYTPNGTTVPMLVGVYVTPEFRGEAAGVTSALLEGVEQWTRERSDRITLHVHEDNTRAHAYYVKKGYRDTGVTMPYDLDPAKRQLEMVKILASGEAGPA